MILSRLSLIKWSISLVSLIVATSAISQELSCRVIINAERIQLSDRSVLKEMETAFSEFLNGTKWTDDVFQPQERINCNLVITLDPEQSTPNTGRFGASVQILSSRPVYNTDYQSIVFNFGDRDWLFEYVISQPLIYNDNAFINNITSLLSFYAYIIIGFDYDTFSKKGGDPYFQKAWQIVTNAQQSGYPGWEQFNSIRNRYWLAENLLNNQMAPVREAMYNYHLNGLDIFQEKPDEARTAIFNAIKGIQTVNQARPRSILVISFLDAKSSELTNLFSQGELNTRRNLYNVLINIDPTKRDTFAPMLK